VARVGAGWGGMGWDSWKGYSEGIVGRDKVRGIEGKDKDGK
jgi:hypothetical protein